MLVNLIENEVKWTLDLIFISIGWKRIIQKVNLSCDKYQCDALLSIQCIFSIIRCVFISMCVCTQII